MAGPFCTMLLADLGADVIKVEPPGGDLSRSMGGRRLHMKGKDHAPFIALNRNKRSIVLDLKLPADRDHLLTMLADADVLVENFRPGVAERLGMGFATVASRNPRLIYASISGFGQSGPWADRPGFDLAAGLYAANGIQAALFAREKTGRGQRVETSLFEAALGLSVWEATEYWATGEAPHPLGSAHRLSAPYQAFRARDGFLTIAALTKPHWEKLCQVLDLAGLALDPRYVSNADRLANQESLVTEIERALASRTVDDWVDRLLAEGIPCGPILDYAQVFDSPHTAARHMVEVVDHPVD